MFWRRKSYEVLPALSVRRAQLRRSLRTVTIACMFGTAWVSCASGSHVKSFARMLGFNDLAFGIMAAVPWLATFGQLIATVIVERTGLRKYQFIYCVTIHRLAWLVLAAIPLLLPIPSRLAVVSMLVVLAFSQFMSALGVPGWFTWMGDLIPRRIRGRYMAYRSLVSRAVQVAVVVTIGVILDVVTVKGAPETFQHQPALMTAACCIFAAAAVLGAIDILLFIRIREIMPTVRNLPPAPAVDILISAPAGRGPVGLLAYAARYLAAVVHQLLIDPLKDRIFRRYVAYGMAMSFAMAVGGWYWWLVTMEHLGFSKLGANVLFLVIPPIAGMLSAKGWGRLLDRWGRRPVLQIATAGVVVCILPYFFATPDTPAPRFVITAVNWLSWHVGGLVGHPWMLVGPDAPVGACLLFVAGCIVAGACWLGINLAQTGVVLGFSESKGRSKYVAAAAVLISIGGVAGGLVGGVATQTLGHLQAAPIGPFQWNNWHAAIALSLLARICGLCLLINMPDPGARPVGKMMRLMGLNVYNAVAPRLFYALRIVPWPRREGGNRRMPKK